MTGAETKVVTGVNGISLNLPVALGGWRRRTTVIQVTLPASACDPDQAGAKSWKIDTHERSHSISPSARPSIN